MLHPLLRTRWFRKVGNESAAEALFKHAYEDYAAAAAAPDSNDREVPKAAPEPEKLDGLESICHVDFSSPQTGAASGSSSAGRALSDELDRYLAGEGGPGELDDPLSWWKVRVICS